MLILNRDCLLGCAVYLVTGFFCYAFTVVFARYPAATIIRVFLGLVGLSASARAADKACNALRALTLCMVAAKVELSRASDCLDSRIHSHKASSGDCFVILIAVALIVCGFPVSVTITGAVTIMLAYARFTEEASDAATAGSSSVVDVKGPQTPRGVNADDRLVTQPEFQGCLELGKDVPVVSVTSQASGNQSHYPDPDIMDDDHDALLVTSFFIFIATSSVSCGFPASVAFSGVATIAKGYDQYIRKVRASNTAARHQRLFSHERLVTKPELQDRLESGNDVPVRSVMSKASCSLSYYDPHSCKMEMITHDDYPVVAFFVIFIAASAVACGFPAIAAYTGAAIAISGIPTARQRRLLSHEPVCARKQTL